MPKRPAASVDEIARALRLNAAAFIVTVYGDIVVPRGGMLWTGTLIDLCSRVGINESLVRTAVSRLVAASQLKGERIGRRSYYRLDSTAADSFIEAANLLYGPDRPSRGWQIIHDPETRVEDARRMRMGHMGGSVFIRPDRGQPLRPSALVFHAQTVTASKPLSGFWDLDALQDGYYRFIVLFRKVEAAALLGADALMTRLLLVHAYRMVLLRDPRLPPEHLPLGWNGADAASLFRTLYLALTPVSHRYIAAHCESAEGLMPAETKATEHRYSELISSA